MINNNIKKHILGFAAYSGTGKTTLLINIIPLLKKKDYKIGVIKHAHHAFDIDKKGKDSYELRKAGANHMLITSNQRWALMVENDVSKEPDVEEYIKKFEDENIVADVPIINPTKKNIFLIDLFVTPIIL